MENEIYNSVWIEGYQMGIDCEPRVLRYPFHFFFWSNLAVENCIISTWKSNDVSQQFSYDNCISTKNNTVDV